uniref:Uncharacterized protein n=1 Tax=Janibacter limosus TaxID=53458 RepID=A0AC61U3L3_9MICO|nr:hypothetical protein [Janibacter limosus]
MFDEELTEVEESFRGLGRARTGVRERGSRADEQALTDALHATERVRRAADALELTVLGQAVRFEDQWGADGVYRQGPAAGGPGGEFAPEAAAVVTRAGIFEAGERCDLAARAVTDPACLTDLLAEGRIRAGGDGRGGQGDPRGQRGSCGCGSRAPAGPPSRQARHHPHRGPGGAGAAQGDP